MRPMSFVYNHGYVVLVTQTNDRFHCVGVKHQPLVGRSRQHQAGDLFLLISCDEDSSVIIAINCKVFEAHLCAV